MHNVVPA